MSSRTNCAGSVLMTAAALIAAGLAGCGDDSSGSGGGGGSTGATTSATSSGATTATSATSSTSGATTSATSTSSTGQGGDTSATGTGGEATTGTGGSGGDGAGVGGGSAFFPDDCDDALDCPGGDCVQIGGTDFRTCKFPVTEATECMDVELDVCCSSDDCEGDDICVVFPDATYCGGAQPIDHNICVPSDDQCNNLDCGKSGSACIPPGVYGYSQGQCAARACTGDADCDAEGGGRCVPVANPCCGGVTGFFCAYPGEGCRDQADCDDQDHCEGNLESGRATCVDGPPVCPA